MKPTRIILLVLGSLMALIGFGLLAAGGTLTWALTTQRDDAGFFSTSDQRFESDTYALTSNKIDLGDPGPDDWWADRHLATVRIRVDGAGSVPVFVGIGREEDVEAYLAGVPHDRVVDVDYHPFDADYRLEDGTGTATPALPADQTFWVAQMSGASTQDLEWDLEPGHWAIVVMNADASRGVAADIELGGQIDYLVQLAIGLGLAGLALLGGGTAIIVAGVAHAHEETAELSSFAATASGPYPVRVEGHLDPALSRWRWLVKWFLAIPHFVVLVFLWIAFVVLTVVAWFAILFTGKYPRSIFDFNVGVLRWTWRVSYYATSGLGTDRYPPFSLQPADYPARLEVDYPERLSRGLVLVKSWLLAIPHLAIVSVLTAGWAFGGGRWILPAGGLLGILVLVAAVALLFTGRYPTGIHDLVVGVNRWNYRVIAYVALMTDRYPPFRLDQGPTEPGSELDAPPPSPPTVLPPPVVPPRPREPVG